MNSRMKFFFSTAISMLLGMCSNLHAGGMTLYEIATAEVRLASAGWAARAEDPSTVFTNPAGMTRICRPSIEFGPQVIDFHARFGPNHCTTTVTGTNGNGSEWYPSGSAFYVQPINDCFSIGAGSLGYFGSDLNMGKEWVGRYFFTKTFLEGFSFVPAAAYQVTDNLSIGLGANIMYGIFDQHSAIRNSLDSLSDGKLLLRHRYLTAGGIAGVLYNISPCTRIGLTYMSPVDLQFNMVPKFKGIGPLLTEALVATGVYNSKLKIKAKVPQTVMVSIYHDVNCCWSVMADAGWQQWSKFQKATINLADANSTSLTVTPKYDDTWHVAAGVEYRYDPEWTFSGGIAYDSSAVTNKNRPIDFPVGRQWRFGTGARWDACECLKFDFCYELLWSGNLPVHPKGGLLTGHVEGKYKNFYTQFLSADLIWEF